jgi:hypothetical protein
MRRSVPSWIVGVAFLLLVVGVSLVAWSVQQSAVDFARESLARRQGVAPEDLELLSQASSFTYPGPSTATVEFRVQRDGRSKKLVVELFRVVYFLPWYVSAYREGAE